MVTTAVREKSKRTRPPKTTLAGALIMLPATRLALNVDPVATRSAVSCNCGNGLESTGEGPPVTNAAEPPTSVTPDVHVDWNTVTWLFEKVSSVLEYETATFAGYCCSKSTVDLPHHHAHVKDENDAGSSR